jgi:hypothetical protein
MTTIAYRDGVMAADTQINSGNGCRAGSITKIGQTADGHWWGFSGNTEMQAACVDWAESRTGNPPEIDGVLIIVDPAGDKREWWGKGWLVCDDEQAAWGSGERIARGAKFVGGSAVQAVQAAIALDLESGGEVTVLRREA